MSNTSIATLFTKLIVDDEQAMASYYKAVYGLNEIARVDGEDAGGLGEPFREIILGTGTSMEDGQSLVMFNFTERQAPRDQQVILGFVTDDIESLRDRIRANGGQLLSDIIDQPEHGVRVLFAADPQGALTENVQLLTA